MFDKLIKKKLTKSLKKYFENHKNVRTVIVVGSVNKAITKNAVATLLSERFKVGGSSKEYHAKDYGILLSVLGIKFPEKLSGFQTYKMIKKAAKVRVSEPANIDLIVQELTPHKSGDLKAYHELMPFSYSVLTSISPEAQFESNDLMVIAKEYIESVNLSNQSVINRDDIDGAFSQFLSNPNFTTYGVDSKSETYFLIENFSLENGYSGKIVGQNYQIPARVKVYGEHTLLPIVAAVRVAKDFGMTDAEIQSGLMKISPLKGRMNLLRGQKNSTIIDDSYNSSPISAGDALRFMYGIPADQKIAVFGSMHGLGQETADWHRRLGELCNPNLLNWVITVGEEANQFLAPAAEKMGCLVKTFNTSLEAGAFINSILMNNSMILFKGSRDGIYLEEAIKIILASTSDEDMLVRQSKEWKKIKSDFFASKIGIDKEIED